MSGSLLPQPKQLFETDSWNPGVAYQIFTYDAGTLTPKATYQDEALTSINTNPVIANARGEVIMYGTGKYRIILKDSLANTIYDRDNVATPSSFADNISTSVFTTLALPTGATLVGYDPAGTNSPNTNVSAYLNLMIRGLKRNYGAALDGVTDDTAKLNNAIADGKIIEVEEGTCLVTATPTALSVGQRIIGWDRYHSKIKLQGAISGFVLNSHCSIEDLRIFGDASMASTSACIDAGKTGNAYRSKIKRCILGGQSTSIGDAGNIRAGGSAVSGGANTFLIGFEDTYFFNATYGMKNINTGTQVNNALTFTGCEFQANIVGAAFVNLNALKFTNTTFEGNDQEGLILGNSKAALLDTCYFESNNAQNTSTIKSDLYIGQNATLTGAATPLGTNMSIENCYFAAGTNTLYGIYQDGQRNVNMTDLFFSSYGVNTSINILSSANNSGNIDRVYISSAAPVVIGSLALPGFTLGTYNWTGVNHFPLQNTLSGVTASLAAAATADIFGCVAGETYLLTVADNANGTGVSMTAIIQSTTAGTLVITILQSVGTTVTNFFGSMRIANNTAGALVLAWSITKIR